MKSKKGIDIVTSVGTRLYDAFVNASTIGLKRVVTTLGTSASLNRMAMQNDTMIVDTISASGGGLPTEKAVADYVNNVLLWSGNETSATVDKDNVNVIAITYSFSDDSGYASVVVSRKPGYVQTEVEAPLSRVQSSSTIILVNRRFYVNWTSTGISSVGIVTDTKVGVAPTGNSTVGGSKGNYIRAIYKLA